MIKRTKILKTRYKGLCNQSKEIIFFFVPVQDTLPSPPPHPEFSTATKNPQRQVDLPQTSHKAYKIKRPTQGCDNSETLAQLLSKLAPPFWSAIL